jgi:hypothetical protein
MRLRRPYSNVSEREYFQAILDERDLRYQQRFDAQQEALNAALLAAKEAVQTALTAAEKAVIKAETAAERRFESVNEFRAQLSDQANTFMPRAEAEQRIGVLGESLGKLEKVVSTSTGRGAGVSAAMAGLLAVGGLVLTALGIAVAVVLSSN